MRSLLFVPGDSERKFAKALGTQAEVLILDLEDSVAPSAKGEARALAARMLGADRGRQAVCLRVNAFDTGLTLADLAAAMPMRPDMVMLPKCRGAADVERLAHHLDAFEAAAGLAPGGTGILPIATESGEAVLGLASYRPHPRLRALMWGAEDLAASINSTGNRDGATYAAPFLLARNLCLMAASAAGVPAIDTVFARIDDPAGLAEEARAARRDGFVGKAVIHPSHVDPVNAAFRPTEAELDWARRVVGAFGAGDGSGVARLDGAMIDKPHLLAARRILASADGPGA